MRIMPFLLCKAFGWGTIVPVFEFGCGQCIDTWSTSNNPENSLVLRICCHVFWNVIDRNAKVELQLCACYGDYPEDETPFDGNDGEL